MGVFIQKIRQTLGYAKNLGRSHPVTFAVLIAATCSGFFLSLTADGILSNIKIIKDHTELLSTTETHLLLWFTMLLFGVFFTENLTDKKWLKTLLIIIFTGFTFVHSGTLLKNTFYLKSFFTRLDSLMGRDRVSLTAAGYILITVLLSLFFCYKKVSERFSFADYLMGILSGSFLTGIVYSVINFGLMFLTFVFTELLFGDFDDIFLPMFAIITGLYLAPAIISLVVNSETDIPKFINILFRYVLFGISLAAYVIVYLYIIKTVFFSGIPSNSIYSILLTLFFFSIPLAYLNLCLETGPVGRISKLLPYIFAPLIILQSYTVIIRVNQYGFTPSRYLGIVLIIIEVVYILWYTFYRDSMSNILLFLSCTVLLVTILPGTNMLSVPRLTQTMAFDRLLSKDISSMSEKEKHRIFAAYDYLLHMDKGSEYMEERYPKASLEPLKDLNLSIDLSDYEKNFDTVDYVCEAVDLDISGYETISYFDCYDNYYDHENKGEFTGIDYTAFPLKKCYISRWEIYDEKKEAVTLFDATEIVKLLTGKDYRDNEQKYKKSPLIYERDGKSYVITQAGITYDSITGYVSFLRLEGYILSGK